MLYCSREFPVKKSCRMRIFVRDAVVIAIEFAIAFAIARALAIVIVLAIAIALVIALAIGLCDCDCDCACHCACDWACDCACACAGAPCADPTACASSLLLWFLTVSGRFIFLFKNSFYCTFFFLVSRLKQDLKEEGRCRMWPRSPSWR